MAEVTQSELYFFIKMMVFNDHKAPDILFYLVNVYGLDFISLRRVQDIVREFKTGERISHKRKEGSGRRLSSSSEENIQRVRTLIEEDNHLSCTHIANIVGIPPRSINRILTMNLKKICVKARWVPHALTDAQKETRVRLGRQLLQTLNRRIGKRLIVTDEKWIYRRNIPSSANQHYWVDSAGDRPPLAKRTISDPKILVIMATNFHGDAYFELLAEGATVNAIRYIQFLQNMVRHFANMGGPVLPENMLLMHDNARPHVANAVTEWVNSKQMTLVPQPPYSPDYNLMDRYVFRNFEVYRLGENFANSEEVSEAVAGYIALFTPRMFMKQLEALKSDVLKVIELNGDYII